ncbi:MAG: QueT transporter family protein [Bacillota bacterium]
MIEFKFKTNKLTRAAIIAALYVAVTYLLNPFSYGPLQFRASEALTVLPIIFPEAVPGVFIGVLIANIFSPAGLIDVVGGSLVTLIAAYVTYRFKDSIIAYLSPVVFNAFLISLYLYKFYGIPYWVNVIQIGFSEAIVVFLLGYPMIKILKKHF